MFFPSLRSVLAGALVASATVNASPHIRADNSTSSSACNNSPDLCDRQYNKITHMGAHGSAFLRTGQGFAAAGNQNDDAIDALDAGLRLLQVQVHQNETLELCHTSCGLLDAGTLEKWLGTINDWMTSHTSDVVTLLLVNSDKASAADFGTHFKNSGLDQIAYTPSSSSAFSDWPTLQSMIDDKKRLVVFVTNMDASSDYPYLIPEFDYVFETSFEVTTLAGFNCTLDRPSNASPASSALSKGYLSLVNHFKYQTITADTFLPDLSNIEIVNNASTTTDGNLGKHLSLCKSQYQSVPNFVLVDFWDRGSVLQATDDMNGISGATGRKDFSSDDKSQGSRSQTSLGTGGALIVFLAAAIMMV